MAGSFVCGAASLSQTDETLARQERRKAGIQAWNEEGREERGQERGRREGEGPKGMSEQASFNLQPFQPSSFLPFLPFRLEFLPSCLPALLPCKGRHLDRRALRALLRVAKEQLPPRRRLTPALEHAPIDERPAVEIVVDVAREDEAVDERRVEEQLLKSLERTEPDQIAAADPHEIPAHTEVPVLARRVDVADDLDVARIADAETVLVREPDVADR